MTAGSSRENGLFQEGGLGLKQPILCGLDAIRGLSWRGQSPLTEGPNIDGGFSSGSPLAPLGAQKTASKSHQNRYKVQQTPSR